MKLIEEIELANGMKLEIFDLSRVIAVDTVKVEVHFQTKIYLKEDYFVCSEDFIQIKSIFGDELAYEHKLERSFVPKENEDSVRSELITTFKNNSLEYLNAVNFAQKMALSKLREIKTNPHKYLSRAKTDHDR